MYEQTLQFSFEAAHELGANVASVPGHAYARVHGHSFVASVTLRAQTLTDKGWVTDFAALRTACDGVKIRLDHQLLNAIDGLEVSTLERIARWIFDALAPALPDLYRVEVARPTLGEKAAFVRA